MLAKVAILLGLMKNVLILQRHYVYIKVAMTELPKDVMMLLSFVNMKLRDEYGSLDEMCSDMQIDKAWLENRLGTVGFTYNKAQNKFW